MARKGVRIRRITKRNPVPESSLLQAKILYEDFTGQSAEVLGTVDFPQIKGPLIAIGEVDFIGYTTVRDGVEERYKHDFKPSARPLFCVTFDGSQIVMLGGAYDFTERGIVDR